MPTDHGRGRGKGSRGDGHRREPREAQRDDIELLEEHDLVDEPEEGSEDRDTRLLELKEGVKTFFEITGVGRGGWEVAFQSVRANDHLAGSFLSELRKLVYFIEAEYSPREEWPPRQAEPPRVEVRLPSSPPSASPPKSPPVLQSSSPLGVRSAQISGALLGDEDDDDDEEGLTPLPRPTRPPDRQHEPPRPMRDDRRGEPLGARGPAPTSPQTPVAKAAETSGPAAPAARPSPLATRSAPLAGASARSTPATPAAAPPKSPAEPQRNAPVAAKSPPSAVVAKSAPVAASPAKSAPAAAPKSTPVAAKSTPVAAAKSAPAAAPAKSAPAPTKPQYATTRSAPVAPAKSAPAAAPTASASSRAGLAGRALPPREGSDAVHSVTQRNVVFQPPGSAAPPTTRRERADPTKPGLGPAQGTAGPIAETRPISTHGRALPERAGTPKKHVDDSKTQLTRLPPRFGHKRNDDD